MKTLKTKVRLLFITVFFLLMLLAFVHLKQDKHTLIIGAKNCTEQHILGEILAILVESQTDLKVVRRFNLEGTSICFNALNTGSIDTYFEYTGTALLDILKEPLPAASLFPYVKTAFEKKYQITWLNPVGFSNQYVLITRPNTKISKISEISAHPELRIAFDPEFSVRLEAALLKESYPSKWELKLMDQVLLYFSLLKEGVDVISGNATDGRLMDQRFIALQDDLECFPKYDVAPIIQMNVLKKYPELNKVFSLIKGKISKEEMVKLNHQVEFEGFDAHTAAQKFIYSVILVPSSGTL